MSATENVPYDPESDSPAMVEARRAMEVCNACRYCEGFCAVFPAMELRREFASGDLNYLANLCHGCRGCYYACQYAPPHDFGINLPQVLSQVRNESYAQYAWPSTLGRAFDRAGLVTVAAGTAALIGVLGVTGLLQGGGVLFGAHPVRPGAGFYEVVPETAMVVIASVTFLFSLLAFAMGFRNFWRDAGHSSTLTAPAPLWQAFRDAATLRYLGGGGHGCNDTDGRFSNGRRYLHHAMAYGFLLCFAATSTGALYDDVLGWRAPYAFFSIPVLLGTLGGIGMLVGTTGLLWQKLAADQAPRDRGMLGADAALLLLLLLIAATGLILLAVRATGALGVVLTVHLGLVLAFFLTMPYTKFVHGLYRLGALIIHAKERPAH